LYTLDETYVFFGHMKRFT